MIDEDPDQLKLFHASKLQITMSLPTHIQRRTYREFRIQYLQRNKKFNYELTIVLSITNKNDCIYELLHVQLDWLSRIYTFINLKYQKQDKGGQMRININN